MITIWVPKRLVEIDLYNVAACSPQQLAQLSEHSYAQRVNYAAEKIRLSGAKIVMLTGPSASGKTTSAHCIARALQQQGTPAQVISLDNFFKGRSSYPRLPGGTWTYAEPRTRWTCRSSSSALRERERDGQDHPARLRLLGREALG